MHRYLSISFWIACCLALMAVTACGSTGDDSDDKGSSAEPKYPEIAAMLPADVREAGSLTVAMSADYPPDHFTENNELTGFDPDFSKALGEALGLDFELVGTNFEGIIPGLESGRYDLAVSTVFVTPERQKVVDYVTYFDSGSSLVVKSGNDVGVSDLDDVCGLRGAVEKGTAQVMDLEEQSKKCVDRGAEPVDIDTYAKQSEANLALLSGQADFLAFNSSAAGYAAKQNSDFEVLDQYASFPSGIIFAKGHGELVKAVHAAVEKLIEDGTYMSILEKWGMEDGAITKPEILPRSGS